MDSHCHQHCPSKQSYEPPIGQGLEVTWCISSKIIPTFTSFVFQLARIQHIYIVTHEQVPIWYTKERFPMISIVNHADIIEKEFLSICINSLQSNNFCLIITKKNFFI